MSLLTAGLARSQDAAQSLKAGDEAISLGEYNAALKHYSAAVEADPLAALVFSKRSAAYTSVGEHKLALRDLSNAIELDPAFTSAYLNRCGAQWPTIKFTAVFKSSSTYTS